jgi:hypothetical protein
VCGRLTVRQVENHRSRSISLSLSGSVGAGWSALVASQERHVLLPSSFLLLRHMSRIHPCLMRGAAYGHYRETVMRQKALLVSAVCAGDERRNGEQAAGFRLSYSKIEERPRRVVHWHLPASLFCQEIKICIFYARFLETGSPIRNNCCQPCQDSRVTRGDKIAVRLYERWASHNNAQCNRFRHGKTERRARSLFRRCT